MFFENMHAKLFEDRQDKKAAIVGDKNNFDKIAVLTSSLVGGENSTNHKIYEWPSDEYLMSLDKDQLKKLKIS